MSRQNAAHFWHRNRGFSRTIRLKLDRPHPLITLFISLSPGEAAWLAEGLDDKPAFSGFTFVMACPNYA